MINDKLRVCRDLGLSIALKDFKAEIAKDAQAGKYPGKPQGQTWANLRGKPGQTSGANLRGKPGQTWANPGKPGQTWANLGNR